MGKFTHKACGQDDKGWYEIQYDGRRMEPYEVALLLNVKGAAANIKEADSGGVRVGDVVVLNSGGPMMVVGEIDEDKGDACCIWFREESQDYGRRWFPVRALTVISPETVKIADLIW